MKVTLRHSPLRLTPRASRVISRRFDPGAVVRGDGLTHAEAVIARVAAMADSQVEQTLHWIYEGYSSRHTDLRRSFRHHFDVVTQSMRDKPPPLTQSRRDLLGAYFTEEYSVESAAVFNPSIVRAPDQRGCHDSQVRFIMSLRGVGFGHFSSIEFRSGVLGPGDHIELDEASSEVIRGARSALPMYRELVHQAFCQTGLEALSEPLLHTLPPRFVLAEFEREVASIDTRNLPAETLELVHQVVHQIADMSYQVVFDPSTTVSERVLVPEAIAEIHGLEDARFVEFEDAGKVTYFGTCSAFDGANVSPQLLRTDDFLTFRMESMFGPAARDKDIALFPRRVNGELLALTRWDRENIHLSTYSPLQGWEMTSVLLRPSTPWDLIQLGACSSPMETEAGWLVLTHGVGPMRTYAIGAMLLDLDDPRDVVGSLREPLMMPAETEREGYVPNVVYSCGALVHMDTLLLPYGCSDASVRFAFVDLPNLLDELRSNGVGDSTVVA